ncbi:alkaline phosphatase isoform A [Micractinium conductrix]|uniref:Alkaline phosphatase isoform A n=1 Tax=Micractinium conductrix TaxID=554055 RepID=A0A2P6VKQ1_9CHLO|nr:alkaline phosphatase isoform A [Micractinium conductrix]|eukprot:PSC74673.1 alkaline phosphatase isoform A [Micractinium conductrix]
MRSRQSGRKLQGAEPLPGVAVERYVGKYLERPVAPSAGGASAAAAAAAPEGAVLQLRITDGSSVAAKVAQLRAHPDVDIAEPDLVRRFGSPAAGATAQPRVAATAAAAATQAAAAAAAAGVAGAGITRRSLLPSDQYYKRGDLWHLDLVSAPLAWASSTGSRKVKVCVIDTGLRRDHQEFTDGRVAKGWNRACTGCFDLVDDGTKPKPGSAEYFNFEDQTGHGTHVAGLIAANTNNSVGVAGMAWQAALYICNVESFGGHFYTSSLLDCYALCQKEGARIYSNSYFSDCLGGESTPCYSQLEYDAIKGLGQGPNAALFVAAAGNGGTNNDIEPKHTKTYPASYGLPHIIGVAATDILDELAAFSTYGRNTIHLAAPGVDVVSSYGLNSRSYTYLSGTSMATPIVSGAAVLLWAAKPDATVAQIKNALLSSVDKVPGLANITITGGRLNAARALQALLLHSQGAQQQQPSYAISTSFNTTAFMSVPDGTRCEVLPKASASWCCIRCAAQPWCWYALHGPPGAFTATCNGVDKSGSCWLVGDQAKMGTPERFPGWTLGLKSVAVTRRRPGPPPPVRRPPPRKGYVGELHGTPLPAATSAASAAAATVATAPDGAVLQLRITDGSSVAEKVAQLLAHPGSRDVKVCVIDTGLRRDHQEFTDGRVAKGWNRSCPTCTNGSAPAPHDVVKPTPGSEAYLDFSDSYNHGTHVAGIIAAATNNSVGMAGVAWDASLFICQATSPNGLLYTSSLLDCYALCQQEKARIVSNSYYSDCAGAPPCYSQLEYDAIKSLGEGPDAALFVVAAGNERKNVDALAVEKRPYPASYDLPHIVSVAATIDSSGDDIATYSNYGRTWVHLGAPGTDVYSAVGTGASSYAEMSGTSMACPVVSGAAALLWAAKPDATVAQVRQALLSSVDPVPFLAQKVATGGRLNVGKALVSLLGFTAQGGPSGWYTEMAVERDRTARFTTTAAATCEASVVAGGWEACRDRCQELPWCWYFITTTAPKYTTITCGGVPMTGDCVLSDAGARLSAPSAALGASIGYKRAVPLRPWVPPPPSPPPPSPPGAGTPHPANRGGDVLAMEVARLMAVVFMLLLLSATSSAASVDGASGGRSDGSGAPPATHAAGQLLVRLRARSPARRLLALQNPLPGVAVQGYVGEHHGTPLPAAAAATTATAAALSAAPDGAVLQLRITDGSSVAEKAAQLRRHPDVELAEPNFARRPDRPAAAAAASGATGAPRALLEAAAASSAAAAAGFTVFPNDPSFFDIDKGWHLRRVGAPLAWATTTGSRDVKVCVIDTGLRRDHQEFTDGRVAKGWNRSCPTCFGGNGTAPHNVTKPEPGTPGYDDFADMAGHGTHVAGIIAAATNNSVGVAGVAWDASLFICQATSPNGLLYTSSLLDCYALCQQEKARIVSNSYYSDCAGAPPCYSQLEYDAIEALGEGPDAALFVVSAGNQADDTDALPVGSRSYPASYSLPNILSVASTADDDEDSLSYFSNYGRTTVHLAAPGSDVWSTANTGTAGYTYKSGTSMACPVVSGAAALLWAAVPNATMAQVRQALLDSVDTAAALSDAVISGGRLNAARALQVLIGLPEYAAGWYSDLAVEQGLTATFVVPPAASCAALSEDTWQGCRDRCLERGWCWYFRSLPTGPPTAPCPGNAASGNCLLAGEEARLDAPTSKANSALGFRRLAKRPPPVRRRPRLLQ